MTDLKKNLVVIYFPTKKDDSSQLFDQLKRNNLKPEVLVEQVMLMKRNYDENKFTVIDFENISGEKKEWKDSILGIIIGFLGGPLGSILGWAVGDIVGLENAHHVGKETKKMFHYISNFIPRGSEGILAVVHENNLTKLNKMVEFENDGKIERFDFDMVKYDLKIKK
ncbi:hypothetical protein PFZ79_002796 [Enterococcus hirae]|nr:hypothetical protein [Enterococcus hirae]